jgi:hypothetical protein
MIVCLAGRDTSINTELSQAAMSFDNSPKLSARTPDVHSVALVHVLFCWTGDDGRLHATPTLYCAQSVTSCPEPVREHDIRSPLETMWLVVLSVGTRDHAGCFCRAAVLVQMYLNSRRC